jgi:hypothetical protein
MSYSTPFEKARAAVCAAADRVIKEGTMVISLPVSALLLELGYYYKHAPADRYPMPGYTPGRPIVFYDENRHLVVVIGLQAILAASKRDRPNPEAKAALEVLFLKERNYKDALGAALRSEAIAKKRSPLELGILMSS